MKLGQLSENCTAKKRENMSFLTIGSTVYVGPGPVAAHLRTAPPVMDGGKVYRRAEFWEPETCTLLEIANVLGRWESASEWSTRTAFSVVEDARAETMAQGASKERFEMAQRNGLVERVAFQQNLPALPFTNARLAASLGRSVADFEQEPVSKAALDVVYDALAESKSSMLPAAVVDRRRTQWLDEAGGINEAALAFGLLKSRAIVCVSWIFFGKGQLYGLIVGGKVALDTTGAFEKLPPELAPYADSLYWVLTLGVAAFAISSARAVQTDTSDYDTVSGEAADQMQKEKQGYSGVLEKWGRAFSGED